MRFGTCSVGSLYRAGSFIAAARELARYKLDLVGVRELRWDKRSRLNAGDYIFCMEKKTKIINWEQACFYTTELYQQLREQSMLVIGCHVIYSFEVAGVISVLPMCMHQVRRKVMIQKTVVVMS